ncbi:hypothetical protein [Nonomuraea dietziae]|uniref:hypothetical protein n=1 Tax=Nonomuraea dietziae TaxID=65515 RepID=UPI0031E3716F
MSTSAAATKITGRITHAGGPVVARLVQYRTPSVSLFTVTGNISTTSTSTASTTGE